MRERADRLWRIVATALCFASFGIGGVVFGIAFFPLLIACVPQRQRRQRIARRVIHRSFGWFVALMCRMGVITFEVHGLQRLRGGGQLILANHPTLIDVVLLMASIERSDCVVKSALGRNPFTRGPVLAAGFVFNDSIDGLLDDCVASVRSGNNLIIFPEGTRTSRIGPLRLQRGAARVAVHGAMDITPVRIHCTPLTLGKGEQWWRVPRRRPHFRLEIGEPIAVGRFVQETPNAALAARRLTEHLTDYFSREPELASA
jgi:1-acyl-sn-glycerol-3-phosphate acyltransferase